MTSTANGCTATDAAAVTLNDAVPDAKAGEDKTLTCSVATVTLSGSSATPGATFSWSGPGIVSGGNTLTPLVNETGSYTLTVTDPSNGCTSTDITEVVIIPDKEGPVFECPAPLTVSCASEVPDPVLPTATDNCGKVNVEWIGDEIKDQTCEDRFTIKRTYRATDVNGFTSDCIQIITVFDGMAPVLTIPADYNGFRGAGCKYDTNPAITGQATVSDNCDKSVEITYTDIFLVATECKKVIARTWKAIDNCGNIASGVQTLTYIDETDPVLVIPADYNGFRGAGCKYDTNPAITGQATVSDNCDKSVEITYTDVFLVATECKKVITRTWIAADMCGNSTTGIQTLTFIDDSEPELVIPANYDGIRGADCKYDTNPATTGQATAIDNCDKSVEVTYTDAFLVASECKKVIVRTWKAVDNCGNVATGIQTLTFVDDTKPVLVIPSDYNGFRGAGCKYDTNPATTGQATAIDNCDKSVEVTYTDAFLVASECKKVIARTWKAADNCGNVATGIQILTFIDDTDPVILFENNKTEYTIEGCDMQFRLPVPIAADNCDDDVILKAYVGTTEVDLKTYQFKDEGITTVTFTATDNCGNSSTATVNVNRKPCVVARNTTGELREPTDVMLKIYPNPFASVVKFEVTMLYDSHIRIDIFTHGGTYLGMILDENLNQGDVRTIEFDAIKYPHSAFLYRITTNSTMLNGTIIRAK
ncbi:MAG: hypothetical protein A2Y71_10525 [Bacteroidetes bacterium RBG_13_42_15]|nr:MAG: hypothetical protein A2Y71_10525 [Bacteroidetes bacterium RBG_13_42_15]